MLCEICHKNHATIHLTEITQNSKKELHICEKCAQQKGIVQKASFSITDVLGKLINSATDKTVKEMGHLKCPQCGITYSEFRSKARFGCPNDYEVLKQGVVPLLEKIHGSVQHFGKIPRLINPDLKKESLLYKLKRELDLAIKVEDFEKAARLRDEIKSLEFEIRKK
jgi:protein arginine kinase activator